MIILFDLNGTLTDARAIGEPWNAPDLGVESLALAVKSAMIDTILGEYRDFTEHLGSALRVVVGRRELEPTLVGEALRRAQALPLQPETSAALDALGDAGCRLAVLTNSAAQAGRATLEAAGVADRFEQILGVDAVERFKPHVDVYRYALRALDAVPDEVVMVAAHSWDVWGAKHAGLRTAWVQRPERCFPPAAPAPDVVGEDLWDVAQQLVAAQEATR